MYVCICKKVTDTAIIEAVENGAESVKDLKKSLQVSSQCGRCAVCARDLIKETLTSECPMILQMA